MKRSKYARNLAAGATSAMARGKSTKPASSARRIAQALTAPPPEWATIPSTGPIASRTPASAAAISGIEAVRPSERP